MQNIIYTKILSKPIKYLNLNSMFEKYTQFLKSSNDLGYLIFLEHNEVFTVGKFKYETYKDSLNLNKIPLMVSERGGDITYHGPGQIIFYPVLNIKKIMLKPKKLIDILENSLFRVLINHKLNAKKNLIGPGIWIDDKKVGFIGLKFSKGISSHGMSINLDIDLNKYNNISPCGNNSIIVGNIKNFKKIKKKVLINEFISIFFEELINSINYPKKNEISLLADSTESDP